MALVLPLAAGAGGLLVYWVLPTLLIFLVFLIFFFFCFSTSSHKGLREQAKKSKRSKTDPVPNLLRRRRKVYPLVILEKPYPLMVQSPSHYCNALNSSKRTLRGEEHKGFFE
jgi:hypothetical protein